jgi:hypothetical protein
MLRDPKEQTPQPTESQCGETFESETEKKGDTGRDSNSELQSSTEDSLKPFLTASTMSSLVISRDTQSKQSEPKLLSHKKTPSTDSFVATAG